MFTQGSIVDTLTRTGADEIMPPGPVRKAFKQRSGGHMEGVVVDSETAGGGESAAGITLLAGETRSSTPEAIDVVVVDPFPVIAEGLRKFMASDPRLLVSKAVKEVAELSSDESRAHPMVVLVEPRTSTGTLAHDLDALRAAFPDAGIVIYFGQISALEVSEALSAGAKGFIPKWCSQDELTEAVREVAAGRSYLHKSVQPVLIHIGSGRGAAHKLTRRELAVLTLMCSGLPNASIASSLQLTIGTTKVYVSRVLSKLGVADRTQAVLYALHERIVAAPSALPLAG